MVTRQFRSGLEETLAAQIEAANVTVKYEETSFAYTWPERPSKYTVDFELPGINGKPIYIEAKGLFDVQARLVSWSSSSTPTSTSAYLQ